jgi:hypothetical protein
MLNPSPEQEAQWENDKRNCLADNLLRNKSHAEIVAWLNSKPPEYREDMRGRLNQRRAAMSDQKLTNKHKAASGVALDDC